MWLRCDDDVGPGPWVGWLVGWGVVCDWVSLVADCGGVVGRVPFGCVVYRLEAVVFAGMCAMWVAIVGLRLSPAFGRRGFAFVVLRLCGSVSHRGVQGFLVSWDHGGFGVGLCGFTVDMPGC